MYFRFGDNAMFSHNRPYGASCGKQRDDSSNEKEIGAYIETVKSIPTKFWSMTKPTRRGLRTGLLYLIALFEVA